MMDTEKYYNPNQIKGYIFTKFQKIDDNFCIAHLEPKHQQSFYGKALIVITPDSSVLFSYKIPIIARHCDDNLGAFYYHRLYNGGYEIERRLYGCNFMEWKDTISPTTLRHIDAFCGMNKKQFMDLPMQYREAREWQAFMYKIVNERGKK